MGDLTITEFLLARVSEDEAVAREATAGPWTAYGDGVLLGTSANPEVCRGVKSWNMAHLSTFDPARVLAECEAKRRIILLLDTTNSPGIDVGAWTIAKMILHPLAQPYADHPDFDPSWKVQ